MKLFSTIALCSLAMVTLAGCPLFSTAKYGPEQAPTGQRIEDLINSAGAPDVIGGNNSYLVLGWRSCNGLSILGLFQSADESTHAAVVNDKGNVLTTSSKKSGSGLAILGAISPQHPGVSLR